LHRLQYRNFGDHETLVVNHTVNVGGGATLGTYRAASATTPFNVPSGGNFGIVEQATRSQRRRLPLDGSAAMDHGRDLAVGYSVSGLGTFHSIRYAGRLASDPPTPVPGEQTLIAGSGVQLSSSNRWGELQRLVVDPVGRLYVLYPTSTIARPVRPEPGGWRTASGASRSTRAARPPRWAR